MTPRWLWQTEHNVTSVRLEELAEVLQLCQLDPFSTILAEVRIRQALAVGRIYPGELLRYPERGPIEAACWVGSNVVPIGCEGSPQAIQAFARHLMNHPGRFASLVGAAAPVMKLWELVKVSGVQARDVRPSQPSLVIDGPASARPDRNVRRATLADYPALLPACVAMFEEEIGYSPLTADGAYEDRVRGLVSQGRSFVGRIGEPSEARSGLLVFKAELGAVTPDIAQVQGVWTHPEHRGRGIATAGMARVIELTIGHVAPTVSLYVNDYNAAALRVYESVGFRQVGEYATVLL